MFNRDAVLKSTLDVSRTVLTQWTAQQHNEEQSYPSLGIAVLTTLFAESEYGSTADTVQTTLMAWLPTAVQRIRHVGLYGGQAEALAGLRLAVDLHPGTVKLLTKVQGWLDAAIAEKPWRTEHIRFQDYDLFAGPAGVLLAGLVGNSPASIEETAIKHLVSLTDRDLEGLRIGGFANDEYSSWMQGGINTGLAHGVPGVLAALSLTAKQNNEETVTAIKTIADWLRAEAFTDAAGVISWTSRGREGELPPTETLRRQAYCYGNPGVSWSLWLAGEAVDSAELMEFSKEAMRSCCMAYDCDKYLFGEEDDQLGICHGAAGTLLVADAFARHAGLAEAAELRDRLIKRLHDNLGQISALSEKGSLLTGAPGMLAALITATGGSRSWLPCLALK